ncbi:MAG: DsbA family oxidoreductase, partial [Pseudomonadota bacterium]
MISLVVISDPICPWCYIGKTRLDRALERVGVNPFSTAWRMFRLNPDMPAEGMDRRAYLEAKFGGPDGAARVYGQIAATAAADGMSLDLDGIRRTPQTLDAHRLIRWSEASGAQEAVVNGLFRRYFETGDDISEHRVLAEIGEEAGMDRPVLERLLASDADREAL